MSLVLYQNANQGHKTLFLDGVLYLINDSSNELGQHYENKIIHDPIEVRDSIVLNKIKIPNIQYLFRIIPDRSVLMYDHLKPFLGEKLYRTYTDAVCQIDYTGDTYDNIIELCHKHRSPTCLPDNSHPNTLSQYAVYLNIIRELELTEISYEVTFNGKTDYDLREPLNNGNRPLSKISTWPIPAIKQLVENDFERFQYDVMGWVKTSVEFTDFPIFKRYMDVYINKKEINNLRVIIFHDSNMIYSNKEWYAQHFKETYFYWTTFNSMIVNYFKPDIVIEITMERFLATYRSMS